MAMFSSVLIANRGEIAVRIARTAKRLGMRVIAVYSEADVGALHVRVADEAYLIGQEGHPVRAYLSVDEVMKAAQRAHAIKTTPMKTRSSNGFVIGFQSVSALRFNGNKNVSA